MTDCISTKIQLIWLAEGVGLRYDYCIVGKSGEIERFNLSSKIIAEWVILLKYF